MAKRLPSRKLSKMSAADRLFIEAMTGDWKIEYNCKRCGYITRTERPINDPMTPAEKEHLCYQCWLDKDAPSQEELEGKY